MRCRIGKRAAPLAVQVLSLLCVGQFAILQTSTTDVSTVDVAEGPPGKPSRDAELIEMIRSLSHQVSNLERVVSDLRQEQQDAAAARADIGHGMSCHSPPPSLLYGDEPYHSAGSPLLPPDSRLPRTLSHSPLKEMNMVPAGRNLLNSGILVDATSNFDESPRILPDGRKKICLAEWKPFVTCSKDTDPSEYTGYMPETFRAIVAELPGWEDDQWFFECMELSQLWEEMLSENGTCYMAAHGMEISRRWLDQGMKYSVPIYRTGLVILVQGSASDPDMFAMFKVFHWDVWLMLGVTSLVMAALIFAMDSTPKALRSCTTRGGKRGYQQQKEEGGEEQDQARPPWHERLLDMTYQNIGLLVATGGPEGNSFPSRLIILAYGLLVVLILALFTANTAAYVTTKALTSTIRSTQDLPGKKVGAWHMLRDRLKSNFHLRDPDIVDVPIESTPDDYFALLNSGEVDAVLLADHTAIYTASFHCDLYITGGESLQSFLAFAFPEETPDADVFAFSNQLIALDAAELLLETKRQEQIANSISGVCGDSASRVVEADTVKFGQVAGLWVILAVTVGVAILYILFRWTYYAVAGCCGKSGTKVFSHSPSDDTLPSATPAAAAAAAAPMEPRQPQLPSTPSTARPASAARHKPQSGAVKLPPLQSGGQGFPPL